MVNTEPMPKLVLGVFVGLLVALGAGWFWGSTGRWETDRAAQEARLRSDLFEARGLVLASRVDIYNVNFGDASRHLEEAKTRVSGAAERLQSAGRSEDVKRLDVALAKINEAQGLAGRLDQGANSRAADAATAIGDVLGIAGKP